VLRGLVVALIACHAGEAAAAESEPARFLSSYHWTGDRAGFGGYSAIEMSADGTAFIIMSDRSHVIEGRILRHDEQIIGVRSGDLQRLALPDSLFDEEPVRDSEGLAVSHDGTVFVSLESDNRIVKREATGGWSSLPEFAPLTNLPRNKGIEALALAPDGALFAIPESSPALALPFEVFRFRAETGWDVPFEISRSDGFLPVGADFDAEGRLYLLERGFGGFGFSSRVRRFDVSEDGVQTGQLLLSTPPRRHDNLEGLAVWRSDDGQLRLTMISDDNFAFFQKTEIVEYALPN